MAQIQRVLVILGGIGPQKRIFSAGEGNYTRFWFRGKQFDRVGEYTPVVTPGAEEGFMLVKFAFYQKAVIFGPALHSLH